METMTTLPRSRPLTRDDLERMPDDGHRYELIDGTLVVTPAPSWRHQRVVTRLWSLLAAACPADLEVFVAPLDVALAFDTVMQPDVLVARRRDLGVRDLPTAPVLAIEVLSPSTRHVDLMLKRSRFEAAGCAHYWVVDPNVPSIIGWALDGSRYVEIANVRGGEEFDVGAPFPLVLRPVDLTKD